MKKEYSLLNKLMIVSISLLIVFLVSITFITLSIVLVNNAMLKQVIDILTIVFISIFIIMNVSLSLFIMINKWQNNWCTENKLLLGILTLNPLSFIASLIFSIKAKKYNKLENDNDKSLYFQFEQEPFDIQLFNEIDLKDDE